MKTGQKQLSNVAKCEPAKTNNSNAHSCALILLFIYIFIIIIYISNNIKQLILLNIMYYAPMGKFQLELKLELPLF